MDDESKSLGNGCLTILSILNWLALGLQLIFVGDLPHLEIFLVFLRGLFFILALSRFQLLEPNLWSQTATVRPFFFWVRGRLLPFCTIDLVHLEVNKKIPLAILNVTFFRDS